MLISGGHISNRSIQEPHYVSAQVWSLNWFGSKQETRLKTLACPVDQAWWNTAKSKQLEEHNKWTAGWQNLSRVSIIGVPWNTLTMKVMCTWSLESPCDFYCHVTTGCMLIYLCLIEHFHVIVTSLLPCWRAKTIYFLSWEIRSIFMQNCFTVSALQHGHCENPLYEFDWNLFFAWRCNAFYQRWSSFEPLSFCSQTNLMWVFNLSLVNWRYGHVWISRLKKGSLKISAKKPIWYLTLYRTGHEPCESMPVCFR